MFLSSAHSSDKSRHILVVTMGWGEEEGVPAVLHVETRDAAEHPAVPKFSPTGNASGLSGSQ